MVEFLVRLLETGLETLENPAATKAQIVKALKAMQRSMKYGEEVCIYMCVYSQLDVNWSVLNEDVIKDFVLATQEAAFQLIL